jgi:heptosyltransferase-3
MKRILIINLKHFGDVLTTTPLLPVLKTRFPESAIYYLVRSGMEVMVEDHPSVEDVIVLNPPQEGLLERFFYHLSFLKKLRRYRFELVIEFSRGDRGALLSLVCGAPVRVGYHDKGKGFFGRNQIFTDLVETIEEQKHTIDFHLDALRQIGLEPKERQMSFYWSEADEAAADQILLNSGVIGDEPFVVIHPTSRWMFKAWTSEGYATVADHIQDRFGIKVIFTSGPDRKELNKTEEIFKRIRKPAIDLCGKLTLKQLGRIIQRAVLFFGVDSAPMHISVAIGTPVLVLFGPSGEHMWGPLGDEHRVYTLPMPCRPCGQDGCNGSKVSRCLVEMDPEAINRIIDEQLGKLIG